MQQLEDVNINHYHIQRHLARGGMSEIYLARDTQTGQMIAIKLVHSSKKEYCERFHREVKAIAALKHNHILPALDYGEYAPWYYMATPYIEAGTLNDRLARGPLQLVEAGEILAPLVSALQFAHDHNIIHRDIKPSNVLLGDGQYVYLTDFGLAKNVQDDYSLTQSGFLIGTPEYMAPELIEEPATAASDIYALGILLYQMLTGRVPFKGVTPVAVFMKHLQEAPTPPSQLQTTIPYQVEQVILHALAKTPQSRFQTAREFLLAYQRAMALDQDIWLSGAPAAAEIRVIPVSPMATISIRARHLQKFGVAALIKKIFNTKDPH